MAAAIARWDRLGRPGMQMGEDAPAGFPAAAPRAGARRLLRPRPEAATAARGMKDNDIRSSIHHLTPWNLLSVRFDCLTAYASAHGAHGLLVRISSPACSPSRISVLPPEDFPSLTVRFTGLPSFAGR